MKKPRNESLLIATQWLCLLIFIFSIPFPSVIVRAQQGPSGPPLLTYDDLVALYENDVPSDELQARLTKLLNTPFVRNSTAGAAPSGKFIRIATWNIERGLEFDAVKAALTNNQQFFRRLKPSQRGKNYNLTTILDQAKKLSRADVVVLNEVDWGLKRTDYRNVARELATAMRMNYAYAVEFVEVDPLTLGTETLEGETGTDKTEIVQNIAVDKSRTLGLHGTAILSRFPLRNASRSEIRKSGT